MTSHDTTDAEHLPTQRRLLEPGSRRCQRLLDGLDREHGQVLQDDSTFASYLSDTDSFPGSIARSDERWQFLSLATGTPVRRQEIFDAADTANLEFFSNLRWQMQNAVRDYSPTSKLYSALTRGFPTDEPQTRKTVHFWTQDQPPTSVEGESTDRRATRFRNAIDFLARLKAKPGTRRQEEDGSDDAGLPMEGKETPEESARALLALNRPLSDDRVPADRATPQNDATGDRAHPARRSRGRVSVRLPISGSSALASIVESDEPSGGTLSRAIPNTYQQTSERGTRIAIGFDIVPTTQSTASTGRASSSTEKKAGSNSVDGRSEASLKRTSITTWVKRSAMTLLGLGALGAGLYALYDPAGSRERAATFIRSTSEIAIAAGNYGRSSIAWGAGAAADGISSLLGD